MNGKHKILLTGATGYVGRKLLKRLEIEGHKVNCLARNPSKLDTTGPSVSIYRGDLLSRESLGNAFANVDTAYFMVHFLHEKHDFEKMELEAAANFAAVAKSAGVRRIIYLGGLGSESDTLSPHLRTRQEVGRILRESCIPTIEFRASIILGSGSLSFELIRNLADHLPFMVTPRWVSTKAQPIGIRDVLDYLVQALDVEIKHDEIIEIGGSDQVSYGDLMREYARQCGLKRMMVPVPVLTPWLSSHWISLFSDVDPCIGRKLIEGMKNPTIVENTRAKELFSVTPASATESMRIAIEEIQDDMRNVFVDSTPSNRKKDKHVHAA